MNQDFEKIKEIILQLKEEYISKVANNKFHPTIPVTERDIVSELYYRLKQYCETKELFSHTEMKAALNKNTPTSELKKLFRIDNVILKNIGKQNWIDDAVFIQNRYQKGAIEARFSSVPIEYFHTAIEVKIQSNFPDLKKDINKLRGIKDENKNCNCFLVLLNARGKIHDHNSIIEYAKSKDIPIIEYTADKEIKHKTSKQKKLNSSSVKIPRRQRIIELVKQNYEDEQILKVLDKEYPSGIFSTSNKQALYGTRRDKRIKW
jgi:hypothetical protein